MNDRVGRAEPGRPGLASAAGAATFAADGAAYDRWMGRFARPLAEVFGDFAGIGAGTRVLDVGCGPGALTSVAVARAGADRVRALDPSPEFVAACRERHPGVDVRQAAAEALPFDDATVDCAAAQLVLSFVSDPGAAVAEMLRVVVPGGTIAACVWDFRRMQLLRTFWDAALSVDPTAPDEATTARFGRPGEIADLFRSAGADEVAETALTVSSEYTDFDDLWETVRAGIGPAGSYLIRQPEDRASRIRDAMVELLGSPAGPVRLSGTACAARARSATRTTRSADRA